MEYYEILGDHIRQLKNADLRGPYNNWQQALNPLYSLDYLTWDFYLKHLHMVTVILFTCMQTYRQHFDNKSNHDHLTAFDGVWKKISARLQIPAYFIPEILIHVIESGDFSKENDSVKLISTESSDKFAIIYQSLIITTTRQHRGEFYTDEEIVLEMVKNSYRCGMRVLDPACGSGIFLVVCAQRILSSEMDLIMRQKAFESLVGFDVNPLACLMSRANLLVLHPSLIENDWILHIYEKNTLFDTIDQPGLLLHHQFDLIIGNPPWIVLNRNTSLEDKTRLKTLGLSYHILRGSRFITSTEITTLFIYKVLNDYLRDDGWIFFLTPASLATGAQHALFRQFVGMYNIEIWAFLQDVFRIHHICFKAQKGIRPIEERINVRWVTYTKLNEDAPLTIQSVQIYFPANIEYPKSKNTALDKTHKSLNDMEVPISDLIVGRLQPKAPIPPKIPASTKVTSASPYQRDFKQGASLVPRNLLFVDCLPAFSLINKVSSHSFPESSVHITPAADLQSKKYSTWEFQAYDSARVESPFIFQVAKSTGLLPFLYFRSYACFLPLQSNGSSPPRLQVTAPSPNQWPLAAAHFQRLTQIYEIHRKKGAQIENLLERLDYGHALSDSHQFSPLKVVYAGIGTIVKAAVLHETALNSFLLIDTSLYYYCPTSEMEAYYLCGLLNTPHITSYVRHVGSTGAQGSLRNIHKHPFDLSIPRYDPSDSTHLSIALQAKALTTYVQNYVHSVTERDPRLASKIKAIQLRLLQDSDYTQRIFKLEKITEKMFR